MNCCMKTKKPGTISGAPLIALGLCFPSLGSFASHIMVPFNLRELTTTAMAQIVGAQILRFSNRFFEAIHDFLGDYLPPVLINNASKVTERVDLSKEAEVLVTGPHFRPIAFWEPQSCPRVAHGGDYMTFQAE